MSKTIKKQILLTLALACVLGTGINVSAATISFDVTVGGTGTQDPKSYKEAKANDGDIFAYFTGTEFSVDRRIDVRSHHSTDTDVKSHPATLSKANRGVVQRRTYSWVRYGALHYMQAYAYEGRVNVKGRYCP